MPPVFPSPWPRLLYQANKLEENLDEQFGAMPLRDPPPGKLQAVQSKVASRITVAHAPRHVLDGRCHERPVSRPVCRVHNEQVKNLALEDGILDRCAGDEHDAAFLKLQELGT